MGEYREKREVFRVKMNKVIFLVKILTDILTSMRRCLRRGSLVSKRHHFDAGLEPLTRPKRGLRVFPLRDICEYGPFAFLKCIIPSFSPF